MTRNFQRARFDEKIIKWIETEISSDILALCGLTRKITSYILSTSDAHDFTRKRWIESEIEETEITNYFTKNMILYGLKQKLRG